MAEDQTFRVASVEGDDLIVPIAEYKKLRDKIRFRLAKFYDDVEFKDAGIDSPEIIFFMIKYGKQIIKKFNVADWLDAERSGSFNDMYTEFTKSKKKSSISIGSLAGTGDGKFRKKKSH